MLFSSIALGALSAGTQALGAIGSFNQQAAAVRAQNRQAMKIYKQQQVQKALKDAQAVTLYGRRQQRYGVQTGYNQSAAQRAYFAEQQRANEILKQSRFADQARLQQQAMVGGKMAASGVSGRSAQRAMSVAFGDIGRGAAVQQEQLRTAGTMMTERNRETRRKLQIANEQAFYNVGVEPTFGPAPLVPMMQQGPSQLGLFAQLGGAALSGFQTYQQYKNYDPSVGR